MVIYCCFLSLILILDVSAREGRCEGREEVGGEERRRSETRVRREEETWR